MIKERTRARRGRPISPEMHGAIKYAFLGLNLLGPTLLGLRGPARTLSYLFGGAQGALNAFTNQPLAVRRVVPFRTHGKIKLSSGPAFVLLPWATGALQDPKARNYFLVLGATLVAVYNLTDWDAKRK